MDGAANLVAGEGGDHALDLPPVAEADDIAGIATELRPRGGFKPGIVAEAVDQVGSIGKRRPAIDEWKVHGSLLTQGHYATADKDRQRFVDHVGTGTIGIARRHA